MAGGTRKRKRKNSKPSQKLTSSSAPKIGEHSEEMAGTSGYTNSGDSGDSNIDNYNPPDHSNHTGSSHNDSIPNPVGFSASQMSGCFQTSFKFVKIITNCYVCAIFLSFAYTYSLYIQILSNCL